MSGLPRLEVLDSLKAIDAADTPENVLSTYMGFTAAYGFTSFMIAQVVHPLRPNADKAMRFTNWPQELIDERYRDLKIMHDPIVRYAMGSRFVFSWNDAYRHASRFGRRMMDEARDHSLGDGITFPMRRPGVPIGGISIGGERLDFGPDDIPDLELLGLHCYSRLEALHPPFPFDEHIALSEQETEVLHFAAVGKTAWETSRIMQISEAAVKDALRRAREKLGAMNTLHACTTAIARDLIIP